ncbi:MAG: flagellar basal body P-ring protein FlgI [Planctomycetes bacterium]|nr:flagellar basal body P-ring protein FlgI [Planctomycetota bacterium]
MKKTLMPLALLVIAVCVMWMGQARAEMVRELVTISNLTPIPLEGVGVVTGLAGTGDKNPAALLLVREYLSNMGYDIELSNMALGSVAMVRVSGHMVPNLRPGEFFDVTVTTFYDATSLQGGELLLADLRDSADDIAARAHGSGDRGRQPAPARHHPGGAGQRRAAGGELPVGAGHER